MRIAGSPLRLKALDLAAVAAALAVIVLASVRAYGGRPGTEVLHLRGPGREWVYPLGSDSIVSVSGPLGETVVQIRGGQARVLSSPCAEQICVRSGAIARPGQWIACLPNRVLLDVRGRARRSTDAVSF